MNIVKAKPDNAAMLTDIAFAAKRHWGYPEKWMKSWRDAFTVQPEFITSHETYTAILDGRTGGFYALDNIRRLKMRGLYDRPSKRYFRCPERKRTG
jgi:hypothetical protein